MCIDLTNDTEQHPAEAEAVWSPPSVGEISFSKEKVTRKCQQHVMAGFGLGITVEEARVMLDLVSLALSSSRI